TIIQSYAPIVQSVCPELLVGGQAQPLRWTLGLDHIARLSRERFLGRLGHFHGLIIPPEIPGGSDATQRLNRRDDNVITE
ncbi:hypothetical protein BGZ65_009645, partial [Modicella reniformis]